MYERSLAIVGPGRVARALGSLATAHGWRIAAVLGRGSDGIASARAAWGHDVPAGTVAELPQRPDLLDAVAAADLLFVATPDRAIGETARALAKVLPQRDAGERVAFHPSGLLPAAALAPLGPAGYALGSLHPLRTFADPRQAVADFPGTPCAVEGEPAAIAVLRAFASEIGGRAFDIPSEGKALYHAAAVIACNYLVTIEDLAARILAACGADAPDPLSLLIPIVRATVDALETRGTPDALTGPIERGDVATVRAHTTALHAFAPGTAAVYRQLGSETVDLAVRKGSISPSVAQALREVLAERAPND